MTSSKMSPAKLTSIRNLQSIKKLSIDTPLMNPSTKSLRGRSFANLIVGFSHFWVSATSSTYVLCYFVFSSGFDFGLSRIWRLTFRQYVDKTTLSYAAIFGIKDGLKLKNEEYSWLSSSFYFGWLIWAIPSNLIMQRCLPAYYLSFNIFMWGVLLMAQAGAQNFAGLTALRILSGAAVSTQKRTLSFTGLSALEICFGNKNFLNFSKQANANFSFF